MKRHLLTALATAVFTAIAAAPAGAQESAPLAAPFAKLEMDSRTLAYQRRSASYGTLLNQPYSAEQVRELVQTLADGNKVTTRTTEKQYRDAAGRTRREYQMNGQAIVVLSDPARQEYVLLRPADKTAVRLTGPAPVVMRPKQDVPSLSGEYQYSSKAERRSLGDDIVAGVPASGSESTYTIPAGVVQNDHPIEVRRESWHARDLRLIVLMKSSDPRRGVETVTMPTLSRDNPDAALFAIPDGYTVREANAEAATTASR